MQRSGSLSISIKMRKFSSFICLQKLHAINVFVTKLEDRKASEDFIYDDDTKHIKKILIDNAKTKEGLRAIVAEIIRRRFNILKLSQ